MLHTIYFSPSGTTKETIDVISNEFGMDTKACDITVNANDLDLQSSDDIIIIASPVYAGRIPALAAERFSRINGNRQKAIVIVVYGNRDYDDALLELCDIANRQGFDVVAAGAFIGEHCIFPKVATGRPDADDKMKIKEFVKLVKDAIAGGNRFDIDMVKGNRPYKKIAGVPLHPKVDKKVCNSCGTCVAECPTGAITKENPQLPDASKCITCCRCIHVCPKDARKLVGLLYQIAGWKFVKDNSMRIEPEWFI